MATNYNHSGQMKPQNIQVILCHDNQGRKELLILTTDGDQWSVSRSHHITSAVHIGVSQGCSEYIYITMHRKTLAITGK
jgi:hypothetical protein